jgi:hypothetical protein
MGGNVRKKKVMVQHKFGADRRMELSTAVASTPLARRMLEEIGPDDFSLLKTFQEQFGARLVHYRDQHGEAGKEPGWVDV